MPLVLGWMFETPPCSGKNEGSVRAHPGCLFGPSFHFVFFSISFPFFSSHSRYTQALIWRWFGRVELVVVLPVIVSQLSYCICGALYEYVSSSKMPIDPDHLKFNPCNLPAIGLVLPPGHYYVQIVPSLSQ